MAVEDINFLDVACLIRVGNGTVIEKFGSLINTSFFDASTIAGTLKQKGLVEFTSDFPGPNSMTVSQQGKALISEAESKSTEPTDQLDSAILTQLSGGKRLPIELSKSLNIRDRDLALRLYKLYKQNLIIYDVKNGGVELLLTEGGFLKMKNLLPSSAQNIGQTQQAVAANAAQASANMPKMGKRGMVLAVAVVAVVVAAVLLNMFGL